MLDSHETRSSHTVLAILLAGLAMSVGWGFRGDYGHEAGAMVPGALLGLAICLGSGREDWWRRATLMAMCGAIGWAFGGQMSYGRVIGYTASSSFLDVTYGYASLFLIGGLWAGIGAAILALSVTQSRSFLERFAGPLVALWLVWFVLDMSGYTDSICEKWFLHDTDWLAALSALIVAVLYASIIPHSRSACGFIATLAAGWWAGYLLLTVVLGLHMTPPRSDNWSGCVGLFVALLIYLNRIRDRVAVRMAALGFLAGGAGFLLGRAQWGPIGRYESLQGLDYWKWMEQFFGLIMGLGVGVGFLRGLRTKLAPVVEDRHPGPLNTIALLFLLVVMMWSNLFKNVRTWSDNQQIPAQFFSIETSRWFLVVGLLLTAVMVVAIVRHRRGTLPLAPPTPVGRAQLLFFLILWIAVVAALMQALPRLSHKGIFFVHTTFWITAGLCSLVVLFLPIAPHAQVASGLMASDSYWKVGKRYWVYCVLLALLTLVVAYLTIASQTEPLSGSHLRFPAAQTQ